jgi:predicted NAD/FAD-dependent oxidoreductase
MNSVVVIGAGMAGLTAARILHRAGKSVTVLDKGRAVGGRLMTRSFRIEGFGEAIGDRGAQYFTVRDEKFAELAQELERAEVIREWRSPDARKETRYIGVNGMVSIAQYLAKGLDVRVEQRVNHLSTDDGVWTVETDDALSVRADALLITAPVPQALELIDTSGIALSSEHHRALENIRYHPCISLMALLAEDSALSAESAQLHGDTLRWVADNKRKGISTLPVLTLHAAWEFSTKHWMDSDEEVAKQMLAVAAPFVGSQVLMYKVHRWRYSEPVAFYMDPCLVLQEPLPLAFAGDAFVSARIEGAALSGMAAAEALLAM